MLGACASSTPTLADRHWPTAPIQRVPRRFAMSARSMLPRYHTRRSASASVGAAQPDRGPIFQLDYATWRAHLAGRPQQHVLAPAPQVVRLEDATWHPHLDGG